LQRAKERVGYLPQVRIHLAPVINWRELYSQRVRWQRGEIEVMAVNSDLLGKRSRFWSWTMPRRLQNDHALALLRLIWAFLLPMFPFFGYAPSVIAQAAALMYTLYVVTDALQMSVAWPVCARSERRLLRKSALYLPLLALYRAIVYFFRLSGILKVLSEEPRWTTQGDWLETIRLQELKRSVAWLGGLVDIWAE